MSLRGLMLLKSIVCLGFGLMFVAIPGAPLAVYGVRADVGGLFMTQLYGAAFVVLGLMLFLARSASDGELRRAIVVSVFVGDAIGFVVALLGQLRPVPVANDLGWSVVALYFLLTVGFGYYLFAQPSPVSSPG